MRRLGGLVAIAVALLAGSALAQSAERPEVKVGDRWRFVVYYTVPSAEPNRTWIVTAVGPAGIEGTQNGELLRMTPELNVLESPFVTDSNPRMLSFPLAVGRSWRYTSDWLFKPKNSRGTSTTEVRVVAREKIRVVAGEFDAFKLVARAAMKGVSGIGSTIDAETTTTYWYAPAARAIVKSASHNPYLGPSTVELVDHTPAR